MAAITNYTTLAAAIDAWDERTHDSAELIGLAEAEFRLHLGPNYAKETSATLTVTAGSAALPTGFVRPLALTHATYGELTQKPLARIRQNRVWNASGIPGEYAITGSTIEVAPSFDGDLTFDYEGTLAGLSASNETNWLITNAPQAYVAMCWSFAKAKFEDWQSAGLLRAQALATLDDLATQSTVGQFGRARPVLPGATP